MTNLIHWLESNTLSCSYKEYFGMHCPGCGIQRSIIELLKGNLLESIQLYPPLLPTLVLLSFLLLHLKFQFTRGATILKGTFIVVVALMILNFIMKSF